MKRNTRCLFFVLSMMLSLLPGCTGNEPARPTEKPSAEIQAAENDPLRFPKDDFTVETLRVKTAAGEKRVAYRAYRHIAYVANPVDRAYESLNVSVPVSIDDAAVDAANAPILFTIAVGGYASVDNTVGDSLGAPPDGNVNVVGNRNLALAAGYVVVSPGCRGNDNQASDGTYFGKAPAGIVDLKAAVRYIRHNRGVMPGNSDRIISVGGSAGGAVSALLGASGNSPMYDAYLEEIGAADADDHIYACACFCPILDLDHADGAYEWMYGEAPTESGPVDPALSKQLKAAFADYQAALNLEGKDGFGTITAENYDRYLLQAYLIPSASRYLGALSEENRIGYLKQNQWITWTDKGAAFSFSDYVAHVGRMKGLPAFDDFDLKGPEPSLFGDSTTNARHFTDFALQQATGEPNARVDETLKTLVNLMNPMYFIGQNNPGCAQYWWLRNGTSDAHTSQTVIVNLATGLANRGRDVNTWLYWDAGHDANEDPEDFIAWIGDITGFTN